MAKFKKKKSHLVLLTSPKNKQKLNKVKAFLLTKDVTLNYPPYFLCQCMKRKYSVTLKKNWF